MKYSYNSFNSIILPLISHCGFKGWKILSQMGVLWDIIELTLVFEFLSVLLISFSSEQAYMNFSNPVPPISANTPLISLPSVTVAL